MKAVAKSLVFAAVMLLAEAAWACPQCALNDKGGAGGYFILVSMITFPFVVVGVALFTLRRMGVFENEQLDVESTNAENVGVEQ